MIKNKIFLTAFLTFVMGFITFGYAALTKNMEIGGSVQIKPKPYEGVYICDVVMISSSGISELNHEFFMPTNLSSTVNSQQINGSITYRITVHNNTDVSYWYKGIQFLDTFESNNLINTNGGISVVTKDKLSDSGNTFNTDDWVPAQTMREFYAVYTFGANARSYLTTLINYHFDINFDGIYDEFLKILNDKESSTGYKYLCEIFDERYKKNGTTVIGNIGADKDIFKNLFGDNLVLEIDGVEYPVTLMIRRENVDGKTTGDAYDVTNGPAGCEYTLYISIDNLSSQTGNASVYAITYSTDPANQNGDSWVQLAQLYEGSAPIKDYDSTDNVYDPAIDIGNWQASANEYKVADGIIYKVGQEQGDQYDKLKTLEDLISTADQDIFNDIDNSRIFKKVYDILMQNQNSYTAEVVLLRTAFANAEPYYNNLNNGQEFKVVRNYTRSQLIPIILKLQDALDYYNQIHIA